MAGKTTYKDLICNFSHPASITFSLLLTHPTLLPHTSRQLTILPCTLKELVVTMGINNLLPHLPGGRTINFCHSFFGLGMSGDAIPLDAASALWQFAALNPNGRLYSTIETSSKRTIGTVLTELNQRLLSCSNASDDHALVNQVHSLLNQGLFDDKYDNISWCAPELPESLIYKTFPHIGLSIKQKKYWQCSLTLLV